MDTSFGAYELNHECDRSIGDNHRTVIE